MSIKVLYKPKSWRPYLAPGDPRRVFRGDFDLFEVFEVDPQWTRKTPVKLGWYWRRSLGKQVCMLYLYWHVVSLNRPQDGEELYWRRVDGAKLGLFEESGRLANIRGGYWCGPVAGPPKLKKKVKP